MSLLLCLCFGTTLGQHVSLLPLIALILQLSLLSIACLLTCAFTASRKFVDRCRKVSAILLDSSFAIALLNLFHLYLLPPCAVSVFVVS